MNTRPCEEDEARTIVEQLVREHDLSLLHQVLDALERQVRRLSVLAQLSKH